MHLIVNMSICSMLLSNQIFELEIRMGGGDNGVEGVARGNIK